MTVHQRSRKEQKVFRSLADLSSISGTSGDNINGGVTILGASAAKVVTADSSSAHVVVTLGAETPDQNLVTAAPAAIVPQPETLKEIIMNANTIETTSNIENAAGAAPAAAPAAPAAPAKSALGLTVFAADHDFTGDRDGANTRLHELGNIAGVLDGRMTAVERQLANLQKSGLSGDLTVSTEKSWEDVGYKVGVAAATGAAVYAGVKLAQWVFDSPAAE